LHDRLKGSLSFILVYTIGCHVDNRMYFYHVYTFFLNVSYVGSVKVCAIDEVVANRIFDTVD